MTDRILPPVRRRWTDDQRLEILRQLDESGLGVREFGTQVGISWSQLYQWRRRFFEAASQQQETESNKPAQAQRPTKPAASTASSHAFTQVHVVNDRSLPCDGQHESRSRMEIAHRSGWSVFVEAGFDTDELTRVLVAVDSRC